MSSRSDRPSFRIWQDTSHGWSRWRWECSLCYPPVQGYRRTWDKVIRLSLPHHFRCRRQHHEFVRAHRPLLPPWE